jgi:hypothetical protein
MGISFETWLSAISMGVPQDIPQVQLALLMQAGYCNQQCHLDLSVIPVRLYYSCHSNLNRPIDHFRQLLLMPPEIEST